MSEDMFLKTIHEHLDDLSKDEPVNIEEFDDVIEEIHAKLGHDRNLSRDIVKSFFNLIRLNVTSGKEVVLNDVGRLYGSYRVYNNKPSFHAHIWKSNKKLKLALKALASSVQKSSPTGL